MDIRGHCSLQHLDTSWPIGNEFVVRRATKRKTFCVVDGHRVDSLVVTMCFRFRLYRRCYCDRSDAVNAYFQRWAMLRHKLNSEISFKQAN